jgi:hypothetical protein
MKIFGMSALDPFEQRAGVVKAKADRGMAREKVDEREITTLIGALDYVFKISNGLMGMNQKYKLEFPHRRTTSGSK